MKLAYFPNQTALNAAPVMQAFLDSCRSNKIQPIENSMDADIAVIWSMLWAGRMQHNQKVWDHYRSQGKPVIVLEVGGLQRGRTWRMGLNGVNRSADFGAIGNNSARAQQLGLELKPWRVAGDSILICLQRSDSYQWANMPPTQQWLDTTINQLRMFTNRPIIVRPHPRQRIQGTWPGVTMQEPKKLPGTYDCFDFDPVSTWAVINWSSNPGMQAVLAGIPAFVGPESLAAPLGNLNYANIEKPLCLDRQQWLNDLAYTEWTVEEIQQGLPLQRLVLSHPHLALV